MWSRLPAPVKGMGEDCRRGSAPPGRLIVNLLNTRGIVQLVLKSEFLIKPSVHETP